MSDERVDIVVTDKVSPEPAKKLRDIAKAATSADSAVDRLRASIASVDATAINRLATASAKLTNADARQTSATARLLSAQTKVQVQTTKTALATQRLATEQARTEAATERAAAAASRARSALISEANASARLAKAKLAEASAQGVATSASQRAATASIHAGRGARQQAAQTQNLIFQVQDVVVGLQAGQKPMTVLLQQGTQIAGAFGPGTGVTGIIKGLVNAIGTMLKPFLPIVAVVAVVAAGFAALAFEINQTTDVAVGMGDVFFATFQLIKEGVYAIAAPAINFLGPYVAKVWDTIVTYTKTMINAITGYFVFGIKFWTDLWDLLPATIGEAMIGVVNMIITRMETLVNAGIGAMNKVISVANSVVDTGISQIAKRTLPRITNVYAGAGEALGAAMAANFNTAFSRDYAGDAFAAISARSIKIAKARIAAEEEENKELTLKERILRDILQPMTEYVEHNKELNALLKEGAISAGQYNQAIAELTLTQSLRDVDSSLTGTPFADDEAMEEIRIAEQERLNIVQDALDARIISEQEAADRIVAINRQAAADMRDAHTSSQSVILLGASNTFSSLADAAKGFAGEQSGAYKAMFIASKAFAIADSIIKIQQGVASAMALPFPINIPAVAAVVAQGASIISNIQSVAGMGFKDGGYTGSSGVNDIAGVVHGKEFVFDAAATQRIGVGNLESMRAGANDNSGGNGGQAFRPSPDVTVGLTVTIQNNGTDKEFDVQQVSQSDVLIIATDVARKVVQDDVPNIVAGEVASPNSRISKSLSANTDVKRRRA